MEFDLREDEYGNEWKNNKTIVFKNGKYGLIDINGKIVVPIEFDKKQILKQFNK